MPRLHDRRFIHAVLLVLLGIIISAVVLAYSGASLFKKTIWHQLLSGTKGPLGSPLAARSCVAGQAHTDDQIYFISCGGIY